MGPHIVTADELPPGASGLRISTRVNGETMQNSNTSDMIFSTARTIAILSEIMTLEPGDMIATGTPSGVAHARKPPAWMKAGDTVEVEVEKIGVLRNPVVDERNLFFNSPAAQDVHLSHGTGRDQQCPGEELALIYGT